MRVSTVRKDGSEYDVHWVNIPPPDVIRFRGLSRLGSYVNRVASSSTSFASLVASTPDGNTAVGVWKLKGEMSVNVSFKVPEDASTEGRVRKIAAERGYSLVQDYLANEGATRSIRIAVPSDSTIVTAFAHLLLHDVLGVRRLSGMHYGFDERDAA
ncbi:MAG: hypothetical protein LC114_04665 [Bryobacterales bacterium]|nr:hypothetical protein [Bryobacterales bacterium]